MNVTRTSRAARYGVRMIAATTAFVLTFGGLTASGLAQPSGGENIRAPFQLAQAGNGFGLNICRDVFRRQGVFLPKHPKADQYGCVHPRFLQRGQQRFNRPAPGHQLRRTGSGVGSRWESEWVRDHDKSNHITTFVHGLNRAPSGIMIWFRPKDTNAMYPVQWSGGGDGQNPVTVELKGNRIRLHIRAGRFLLRAWNARQSKWRKYKRGAWKVIVLD